MSKLIISLYVLSTSLALIALKYGSKAGAPLQYVNDKLHLNFNFYNVSGVILYVVSFLLYIYLISKYDLGYIIPLVTALVYVVIFVASFFIFKEVFTVTKIIGIALIVCGMLLLNLKK